MMTVKWMKCVLEATPEKQSHYEDSDRVVAPTSVMIDIGNNVFVDCNAEFVKDPRNPYRHILLLRPDNTNNADSEGKTDSTVTEPKIDPNIRDEVISKVEELLVLIRESEGNNEN